MVGLRFCVRCRFFLKQKTAYEMRSSDWSSDVCSSDLLDPQVAARHHAAANTALDWQADVERKITGGIVGAASEHQRIDALGAILADDAFAAVLAGAAIGKIDKATCEIHATHEIGRAHV